MPAPDRLTEYDKAAALARYVQIESVSLDRVEAQLLAPRRVAMEASPWQFGYDRSIENKFDEESKTLTVLLKIVCGLREATPQAGEAPREIFRLGCTFALAYSYNVQGGPEGGERDSFFAAFANLNGMYNVWPYFRELLQSTVTRMGLPPVVVPVFRVPAPNVALTK